MAREHQSRETRRRRRKEYAKTHDERPWGCYTWVLSLTSSNSDHLDTTVGEGSVDKSGEETEEAASVASALVFSHRTGILPVTETKTVMGWTTSKVEDNGKEKEAHDSDEFDRSETEFSLAID